jgi:hypothetical protein
MMLKKTQQTKKILKAADLKDAVLDYLKQNSDSFKETLDRALKPRDGDYDNTKGVLNAFCKSSKDELTKNDVLNFKANRITYGKKIAQYLSLLTTADYGEILRFDENSGKYSFSNPFFKAYVVMQFSTDENSHTNHNQPQQLELARMEEIFKMLTLSIDDVEVKLHRTSKKRDQNSE